MTSGERKIARLKKLVADINNDIRAITKLTINVQTVLNEVRVKSGPVSDRDMMLLAAFLHHFYTALESVMMRISSVFDGGIDKSGDYHRELLNSMTIEIEGVRPQVFSIEFVEELDDYRRFRHMFRHAYAGELRWKKMGHLAENINTIYAILEASLLRFTIFIANLIKRLEY